MPINGLEQVRRKLSQLVPDDSEAQRQAERMAWKAVSMITDRTTKGRDRRGRPFRPYSKKTAELRRKRGRQTDHVDLTDKGHMLAAMTVKPLGRGRAEVTFANATEARKAAGHQFGKRRLPKREFFGLSAADRQALAAMIKRRRK